MKAHDLLKKQGFDGVNNDDEEYIAFNPTQIKSATGNNGNYDASDPNIFHQFAGERAKTADRMKLQQAQKMDADGKSADDIYESTGWLKGRDGKWRFEIPDNVDAIDLSALEQSREATLAHVYKNDVLYDAYPFLRRVKVALIGAGEKKLGNADSRMNVIALSREHLHDEEMPFTLIHEIQHLIQDEEGFARGGNPKTVRRKIKERIKTLSEKLGSIENANDFLAKQAALEEALLGITGVSEKEIARLRDEHREYTDSIPGDERREITRLGGEIRNLRRALEKPDIGLYRRLGGEQEARHTADRARGGDYDAMSRPHGDDAIIIFDGVETPYSQADEWLEGDEGSAPSDVSKMSTQERVDQAVNASENNMNLAMQLGGEMRDGKMTFPDAEWGQKFLDAVNAMSGMGTGTKFLLDNSETLTDNERRAIENIKDDMSFGEARELFIAEKNRKIAKLFSVFDRVYETAKKTVPQKAKDLFKAIKEAREDANETRNGYTTAENVENLERLLRNGRQLGEGSYLARDLQRVLDAVRSGGDSSSVANIPGEFKRMYNRIEALEQSGKFSYQGTGKHSDNQGAFSDGEMTEAERMRRESRILPQGELEPRHRKIQAFGEGMGVPVVFFEGDPRLHGYHGGGVTYLNVRSEIPIQDVFWHESFHWMRNNNPGLYADLMTRMEKMDIFSDDELDEYRESIGRPELTNEQAIEEMLADIMMDKERREDIMQRIAAADRGLIERFMAWLRDAAKTFQEFMKNPDAGLTRAKIAAMNRAIAAFARKCVDGNGNRVFRVTPRGEILRANGGALPAYSVNARENWEKSLAGNQAEKENQNNSKWSTDVPVRYTAIPNTSKDFVLNRLKNPDFANRIKASDDIDSVCEKIIQSLRLKAEVKIDEYLRATSADEAQRHLNAAAYLIGMFDEIRRDFDHGGQICRSAIESGALRRSATRGSALARSIQNRRTYGKATKTGESPAVDGFSSKAAPIVARIREQDRGDGIKFSINLGNKGRSGNQGGLSRGARPSFMGIVRNKLASVVGDGTMRIRKEMKDALERAAGVAIRAGHIDSMTNVKTEGGVIRTRNASTRQKSGRRKCRHRMMRMLSLIFDGKEIPVTAKKKTNAKENWENSLAGEMEERRENKKQEIPLGISLAKRNYILRKINDAIDNEIEKMRKAGMKDDEIAKQFNDQNSVMRKNVLKWVHETTSLFTSKKADKRDFVLKHTEGLNIDTSKEGIERAYNALVENARRLEDYASTIYGETAYSNRRGSDGLCTRFGTWNELRRAQERHGGNIGETKYSVNLLKGEEYYAREYAERSNGGGARGNRHNDDGRMVRVDGGTQQGTGASPKIQYSINLGNKGRSGNQGGLSSGAEKANKQDKNIIDRAKEKLMSKVKARAEKMAQEYMDRFGETYHDNSPERQALRRDIIKKLYGDGAKKKNGEAFLIIGLPASGKSSIAKPIIKANGALQIDSDDVKEQLPEFSNGLLARAVHEESSAVAEEIFRTAMSNGDNMVLPLVGKTESNLQEKIGKLKDAGYTVHLIYLDLPMEETIRRGENRFKEDGRLVPVDYIRSVGLKPKQNYDKMKIKKGVDDYAAWGNDVPRGSEPRLLESSSGADPLRWLGRGLDTQSLDAVRTGSDRVSQEARSDTQSGMERHRDQRQGTQQSSGKNRRNQEKGKSVTVSRSNQGGFSSGKETTVVTDSGRELSARYKLVEADGLVTSHNAKNGLAVNKDYPAELQPRDRQRVGMQEQISRMANNLRPDDLGKSRNLNEGAPVVNGENVVLNGNGRSIAIIRAQKGQLESGDKYRAWLRTKAEKFGLSPEAVKGMKSPVLVRSIYKGDVNYANSLIIGVEKGQDGRIVTVFMSGNKRDKKAALRDFKKRLSGENTSKVLYLRVGLSGHSRSTTEHRTSPGSTSLRPSGTQSIPQEQTEGKKKSEPLAMNLNSIVGEGGGDLSNTSAFDAFKMTIDRKAGQDAFDRTMNREMDYDGVKETRREHIERIFREHPEWTAAQIIRKPKTKDIYGFKQTDYQIYHDDGKNKNFAHLKNFPFEYITQAEKKYLDFLHGFEPLETNNAYAANENLESFADVIKEGRKRDAEIDAYIESHPEAKDMPLYKVEEKIAKEQEQSAQNQGDKKVADEGGKNNPRRNEHGEWVTSKGERIEIADGYQTKSGRLLDSADKDEFIIKPDGGKDFREISQNISDAVMEQSGEELRPGPIRLKVGDGKEGLIHAKEHETQAKDAGYSSIEDMIDDVARNFDHIYKRNPKTGNGKPSYTLVKVGDKSADVLNVTSPIHFELQDDGEDGYYLVITAIPKGDRSLASQTKKDHLIYRSPALDAAATSSGGAVYASPSKNAGAEGAGLPTSDKSNNLVDSTIPQNQQEGKGKRNAYSDVIDDVTRELAESRPRPTLPGRKRGNGGYVPGVIDEATRMIREQDDNRQESRQEFAPEVSNTSMEEQAETVKGESNNGQEQEQGGSADGGHEVERSGESEADERSSAGEVSGRDGREGTRVHGSAG